MSPIRRSTNPSSRTVAGPGRGGRGALAVVLLPLLGLLGAAAPPEVIRIHIPAGQVTTWFPEGTPLRLMATDELETLLQAARRGAERANPPAGPRLLRARHRARWDRGLLVGSSELVVERPPDGAAVVELSPWTPVIMPRGPGDHPVGALATGQTVVHLSPREAGSGDGNSVVTLEWRLRALPGTDDRSFALGLPGNETSELTLELPSGWVPLGPRGFRHGPSRAATEGRETWRFHGQSGQVTLRLARPGELGQQGEALVWVNGPTEVRLGPGPGSTAGRDDGFANWKAEWQVQAGGQGEVRLSARLDPGLELLDVSGPEVRQFLVRPEGSGKRVTVTLAGLSDRPSPVRFRARAPIPIEGVWSIPAIAPVDAVWTGGTTTLIRDPLHVIRECRERAGVRLPSPPGAEGADKLVFEARAPESVAELVLRPPHPERACRVRGRLRVSRHAPPELECRLDGLTNLGSATEIQVEISPAWAPDRVSWGGGEQPIPWHTTVNPDGSTRLRVLVSATEPAQDRGRLVIAARSSGNAGRGSFALPRVRPVGFTLEDETWSAEADPELTLHPIKAAGLAWLDPARADVGPTPRVAAPDDFPTALAWRWTGENAGAVVECDELDRGPRAEIRTRARIERDARAVEIDGEILIQPGTEELIELPFSLSRSQDPLDRWTFRLADRTQLRVVALDDEARPRLGFGRDGRGGRLLLPQPAPRGPQRIRFHTRLPWAGRGPIPLLSAPKRYFPRGTVVVEVPAHLNSRARTAGLRRLDPPFSEAVLSSWGPESDGSRDPATGDRAAAHPAHAFTYTESDVQLLLETEELSPAGSPAIVREALLTTLAGPGGRSFNRIRLLLQGDSPRAFGLGDQPDTKILRVLVDGVPVEITRDGGRLRVPLPQVGAGPRTWTIDLDFERTGPPLAAGSEVRPAFPASDLPCLAFAWELITPPTWQPTAAGDILVASDPSTPASWPLGCLGLTSPRWRGSPAAPRGPGEDTFRRLDESLSRVNAEEFTFAQWFTRWDTPATPLLIDRLALAALGYGPRTPCLPSRSPASGPSTAIRTLRQYGLALVGVDSALLVTSAEEAARHATASPWRSALDEAQLWGSDHADRFQSAARWSGEPTPREAPPIGTSDALRPPPGWSSWRFTGAAWPDDRSRVVLVDVRSRPLPGWGIAAASLAGLAWIRGRSRRAALVPPLAVLLLAVLIRLWFGERLAIPSAGLLAGGLLGLLYRLGLLVAAGALRKAERPAPGRSPGRSARPLGSLLVRATCILPLLLLTGDQADARREPDPAGGDPRIPVLIPYEGAFDASQPPRRVVLRESDYRTLQGFTRLQAPPADAPLVLLESSHQVSWTGEGQALIASELRLLASSPGPASWTVPIAGSREISASLDGRAVPIFITKGGTQAEVPVAGKGEHRLQISRGVSPVRSGDSASLNVPVNSTASARLLVQALPGRWPLRTIGARGDVSTSADRSITAELGPVGRLEIQWGRPDPTGEAGAATNVIAENVQLWDIEPAGDVLRARISYRGGRPLSTLRFRTDPGLQPRRVQIPGLVAASRGGPADPTVWTVKVDPPLAPPATIDLEMWRSLPARKPGAADGEREAAETARKLPRLEPLDVERGAGMLGVRRPGHWTGRQEPVPGSDPLSDENFVKLWGALPDDRLTLSGTTRFGPADVPEFRTGPATGRLKVKPALQLAIDAGRVDLQFDAEIEDPGDASSQLDLQVPEGLVVVAVRSDGLTDWDRVARDRLRLRYDRSSARSRRPLRISGYLPVASDSLRPGLQPHRIPTPWIVATGMDVAPGTITVSSETRVEPIEAPGLTLLPAVPLASTSPVGAAAESLVRQTYRIAEPAGLGWLQWTSPPPRVSVRIESQLTLYPDAAEWTAVIRYEVLGGALELFSLKLPTAWALRAQVEFDGAKYDQKFGELGPFTFWRIIPERPAWGTRRLVLRSTIPLSPGQEIQHPEVSPLGWGRVDTYLRLVTATDSVPMTAGSNSLKEVIDAGRFQPPEFWRVPGARARVFHVARENWSLKVQAPKTEDRGPDQAADSSRVLAADLVVAVQRGGSLVGRGSYDVQPRSGRFLIVAPPPAATLLWTTVDQVPVRPLTAPDGRWFVPLADEGRHRVGLYWRDPLAGSETPARSETADWPASLPRAGVGKVPTLVTIRTPEDRSVRATLTDLEPVSPDRVQLERADRIAQQINGFLAQMDRRSGRDRERVGAMVIAHELAIRGADRSLRLAAREGDRARRERAERDLEIVRSARKSLLDGLRSSLLEDEVDAALAYLGQATPGNKSSTLALAAPPTAERIRSPGQPTFLIGLTTGLDEDATTIAITPDSEPKPDVSPERARLTLLTGFLAVLGILAACRPDRPGTILILLAAALGLVATIGGPPALALGLAVAAAGWLMRTPPPDPVGPGPVPAPA